MKEKLQQQALAASRESFVVIDVRGREEFEAGHVDGAVHIPLDELATRLSELPASKIPVVACNLGGWKAEEGARILHDGGRQEAVALEGGTAAWQASQT